MKKLMKLGLGLSVLALTACASQTASNQNDQIDIVTTFYPVYEFTKQVAGDEANVELMIPAGTEVHDFEPSAKNVASVQEADVFVYENENMETWAPELLESVDTDKVGVIRRLKGCCCCQAVRKKTTIMRRKATAMPSTRMSGSLLSAPSSWLRLFVMAW